MEIGERIQRQRDYFAGGATRDVTRRVELLEKLKRAIRERESEICDALRQDLNKSAFESYMTEVGMTLSELDYMIKHTPRLARTGKVRTPLAQFRARSYEIREPYGVVLVMSPWNYPFLLSLDPAIGAVAAGNCCIIKPSAYAPASSRILKELIGSVFEPGHVTVVEGGREENTLLLEQKFDYIFFTGSVNVGKTVMEKAARHLTPVTLELGGKSPCIVDRDARLSLAAKRIAFGKLLNSGQTCVAPDYCLVHEAVKEDFVRYLIFWMEKMAGKQPFSNPDYPRMINEKHYDRVMGLIKGEKAVLGGCGSRDTLQIAPTVLTDVDPFSPVMREEIFGPVLPVLSFQTLEEAQQMIRKRPRPLALYLFTEDQKKARQVMEKLSFGGGCINDTIIHLATSEMGFGGVGESGMGSYHGRYSFDTFTHVKSVVEKATWMDLPIRYMPYSGWKEKLLRRFM